MLLFLLLLLLLFVKTTPHKTRFRDVKYARIWDTDGVDDNKTKSDYNIQKERTLYLELRMRGEMKLTFPIVLLNGETSDTNDNVKTKINTKHMKTHNDVTFGEHVNVRVVVSLLRPCSGSAIRLTPCTHRIVQGLKALDVPVFVSSHPCMKWAFPLTSLIITFIFFSFLINLKQFVLPFNFPEVK